MNTETNVDDRLYFKQLLAGRDFAVSDDLASQMVNFVYLIGDRLTREALVIDPAYAVSELLDIVKQDDMKVIGALATHYHADHVGGSMMGLNIEGAAKLLQLTDIPIHIQTDEAPWIQRTTGIQQDSLQLHTSGDKITVGEIEVTLLHTPGHTPGSQCFLVKNMLVAGDTLFLEGCGRTDLPGSNSEQMYESLQLLGKLDDDVVVYPGHQYSIPKCMSMGEVRNTNYVFKPKTKDAWMQWFGGA